jgi:hypothetical protein
VDLANFQHREPSFLETGGHKPIGVAGDEKAHVVAHLYGFFAFELDQVILTGDQILELS